MANAWLRRNQIPDEMEVGLHALRYVLTSCIGIPVSFLYGSIIPDVSSGPGVFWAGDQMSSTQAQLGSCTHQADNS